VSLDLQEESDGTRRLLNLIPALQTHGGSAVYFIDEIDRSLHPMLVWKFLEFFLKSPADGHRQIIVTTHESNLLDLDLLRRDEIWFAEKDQDAATHLYSMVDFKVRKDHEIRKHYLQGRFGAVPFLGNLDRLLEEQTQRGCESD
jgi:AAA15 family ATPase/GTPase